MGPQGVNTATCFRGGRQYVCRVGCFRCFVPCSNAKPKSADAFPKGVYGTKRAVSVLSSFLCVYYYHFRVSGWGASGGKGAGVVTIIPESSPAVEDRFILVRGGRSRQVANGCCTLRSFLNIVVLSCIRVYGLRRAANSAGRTRCAFLRLAM